MNIDEVQTMAAAQIAAVPALAAFGTPIVFSYALDDEATKAAFAAAMRDVGVMLEVGQVSFTEGQGTQGRFNTLQAHFEIFVAENPKVAHSPSGDALVLTVIRAVNARIDAYETSPICTGKQSARAENGYILHEISFSVPVIVR